MPVFFRTLGITWRWLGTPLGMYTSLLMVQGAAFFVFYLPTVMHCLCTRVKGEYSPFKSVLCGYKKSFEIYFFSEVLRKSLFWFGFIVHRLGDTRIEVIANVSCPDVKCACDWSMKVGSITQSNPGVHSKFPIKLAMLVLWHYSLSSETILQLSENVQGMVVRLFCEIFFPSTVC